MWFVRAFSRDVRCIVEIAGGLRLSLDARISEGIQIAEFA